MKVSIINYGAGNIRSVTCALERLGCNTILTNDAEILKQSDRIIFPGVGHAGSAMTKLKETKLDRVIPLLKQPFLGICVGMQLMCNSSEEGLTEGLRIFDTEVKKLSGNIKIPQIGWNSIHQLETDLFREISESDYMYFVNSYVALPCKETIALSEYGEHFSVALGKNNFYGVQCHPEKSGTVGSKILNNFLSL